MQISFVELTSIIATSSTILLYLTGLPVCYRVIKARATGDISLSPFLVNIICTCLWLQYGAKKEDATLFFTNACGFFLNFVYVLILWNFNKKKISIFKRIMAAMLIVILDYMFVHADGSNHDDVITKMGFINAFFSVLAYGAPLFSLTHVMRTKSTDCLIFPMCCANLLVSIEWFLYGILITDFYIKVPNSIGVILSLIQLSLFLIYPRKSGSQDPVKAFEV